MKEKFRFRTITFFIAILVMSGNMLIGRLPVSALTGTLAAAATPSDDTPAVGAQITLAVSIDMTGVNAPDNKLGSYSSRFDWNPAVLSYVSYSGAPPAGFSGVVNVGTNSISFNGANASGATGVTTLITITFDVIGEGFGALDLEFSALAAAGTFVNLLPVLEITEGSVIVGGGEAFALLVSVVGSGMVTKNPNQSTYGDGTVVDLTPVPDSGYMFDGWTGDNAGDLHNQGDGTWSITMDEAKSLIANFIEIPVYDHFYYVPLILH